MDLGLTEPGEAAPLPPAHDGPPTDLPGCVERELQALLAEPAEPPDRAFVTPLTGESSRLSPMWGTGLIERPVDWVALAGFMGTGKSRVGWELSRALALHFVDTDKLITRVVGKSIPEVFEQEGESYFRSCEAEVVHRVSRLDHAVISLGGGTFIHEANRRTLLERGPVVVLWATPETVYQRTKHSDRPLLRAEDPLGRIRSLMDEREGVYREGTIHVHSDGRPSEEIVEEIIERLWNWSDAAHAWAEAPEALADRAAD
ncbi:hypothetical protein GCM10010840_00200 [Deinococcus aerolatus]|uniref:Shikimate kinase n=1 Tax=Deinococcus aerolatus TaxID=522487 RepID=A0ABQ2FYN5_9DEIO|nr:shikimate kinase [Deinococcus aerolatus]GGL66262.1 hypothetical protein GCM10010840_00200 [Deinococcus aerolatus]